MRCNYVTFVPQPSHFDFFINAPVQFQCQEKALESTGKCPKHTTKQELLDLLERRVNGHDHGPKGIKA